MGFFQKSSKKKGGSGTKKAVPKRGAGKNTQQNSSIFGIRLETILKNQQYIKEQKSLKVPFFLLQCGKCLEFEKRGIETEMLFSKNGKESVFDALKVYWETGVGGGDITVWWKQCRDYLEVCDLIKYFLRNLPEPLIPAEFDFEFKHVQNIDNSKNSRLETIFETFSPAHRDTLFFMLQLLNKVALNAGKNKMTAGNLATIFGPIMCPSSPMANVQTLQQDSVQLVSIMTHLISFHHYYYTSDTVPTDTVPTDTVPTDDIDQKNHYHHTQTQKIIEESLALGESTPPAPPIISSPHSGPLLNGMVLKVIADYDFVSRNPTELSITRGQVITVLSKDPSGWWRGKDLQNNIGLFPSNYTSIHEVNAPVRFKIKSESVKPNILQLQSQCGLDRRSEIQLQHQEILSRRSVEVARGIVREAKAMKKSAYAVKSTPLTISEEENEGDNGEPSKLYHMNKARPLKNKHAAKNPRFTAPPEMISSMKKITPIDWIEEQEENQQPDLGSPPPLSPRVMELLDELRDLRSKKQAFKQLGIWDEMIGTEKGQESISYNEDNGGDDDDDSDFEIDPNVTIEEEKERLLTSIEILRKKILSAEILEEQLELDREDNSYQSEKSIDFIIPSEKSYGVGNGSSNRRQFKRNSSFFNLDQLNDEEQQHQQQQQQQDSWKTKYEDEVETNKSLGELLNKIQRSNINEMKKLQALHQGEIGDLNAAFEREIEEVKTNYEDLISEMKEQYEIETKKLKVAATTQSMSLLSMKTDSDTHNLTLQIEDLQKKLMKHEQLEKDRREFDIHQGKEHLESKEQLKSTQKQMVNLKDALAIKENELLELMKENNALSSSDEDHRSALEIEITKRLENEITTKVTAKVKHEAQQKLQFHLGKIKTQYSQKAEEIKNKYNALVIAHKKLRQQYNEISKEKQQLLLQLSKRKTSIPTQAPKQQLVSIKNEQQEQPVFTKNKQQIKNEQQKQPVSTKNKQQDQIQTQKKENHIKIEQEKTKSETASFDFMKTFVRIKNTPDDASMVSRKNDTTVGIRTSPTSKEQFVFSYDRVFSAHCKQEEVFNHCNELVSNLLAGHNSTLLCYGTTGAGKSYTLFGLQGKPGCVPRSLKLLFDQLKQRATDSFELSSSMTTLNSNEFVDLLNSATDKPVIHLKRDSAGQIFMENLKQRATASMGKALAYIEYGLKNRQESSDVFSPLIYTLTFTNKITDTKSKLHFVKLPGAEFLSRKNSLPNLLEQYPGLTQEDAKGCTRCLLALGAVLGPLAKQSPDIPYRNHKLTSLLSDSLNIHSKTFFFVNLEPSKDENSLQDQIHCLNFAKRAIIKKKEPL